ncbi:MAG: DegT/DnrJ/EryC1/StrS family aminotransferase [Patescibacteria group bacterium]
MNAIPFGNLSREYHSHKKGIDAALQRVLRRGWFILGPEVELFEKEFAKWSGARYAIGTANGLEALQIALMGLGIGPGDEVITTPLSAVATALAITAVGARVIFADIDPDTFNLDPLDVAKRITSKTVAILPVHLYGQAADLSGLRKLARDHDLFLVEDCAQAHGAQYHGRHVGTFGEMGAFSFYPSKNLGAYGDAGCIITNDKKLADHARALRDYGQVGRYNHVYAGINSRLDEIQAAILRVKLRTLRQSNARRRRIAAYYTKELAVMPLKLPLEKKGAMHVWHQYVVRTSRRAELARFLARRGIATQVHYPAVIYKQPVYRSLGYHSTACRVAERAVTEILSLPVYPELTDAEVRRVVVSIKDFFQHGN